MLIFRSRDSVSTPFFIMIAFTETAVFWNDDGYVEIVLIGVQEPEQLSTMHAESLALLEKYGPANVLIDGRNGRVSRDASSFMIMRRLHATPKLKKMFILIDKQTTNPVAGRESGIVITILTTALGLRPIYIFEEEKARKLARESSEKQ